MAKEVYTQKFPEKPGRVKSWILLLEPYNLGWMGTQQLTKVTRRQQLGRWVLQGVLLW